MEEYYGYAGSILDVDLTTGRVKREKLNLQVARSFIGGLGVNIKLWYDLVKPGVDPLSPENAVIIGVGPLVGTAAPGSSRVYSLTKLPVNGAVGWGGGGGVNFGCMLKNAGFDHVIIRGRAEKPVYISICDGEAEIVDAGSLWGEGIGKATDTLKEAYGGSSGVLAIGQGGENLVRFSMAFIDKLSTIGRGGLGAVMGSKNLKAIVVRGTGTIPIAHPKEFLRVCKNVEKLIHFHKDVSDREIPLRKSCTMSCTARNCPDSLVLYKNVPGRQHPFTYTGVLQCASHAFSDFTPWEAGFEAAQIANMYGINHWEIVLGYAGIGGWLKSCDSTAARHPRRTLSVGTQRWPGPRTGR